MTKPGCFDRALQRLGTDYIDLLQLHHFDAQTAVDPVMRTLDDLVRAGKVLYVGASNLSGWHLMKSQAVAERYGYAKYVAHQVYYSLIGRDEETWRFRPTSELRSDSGARAPVPVEKHAHVRLVSADVCRGCVGLR